MNDDKPSNRSTRPRCFPALALILVPLLWQAARKPALPAPV